ncbi:MAG: DUF2141 domain-containing protein [Bacteroidota bacterium]
MRLIWIALLFLSVKAVAQHEIIVEVSNVPGSKGKISVALYDTEDSFLKFEEVYASASSMAKTGKTNVLLEDIPDGNYAIALFYDKNGNDKLDTNWIGIPKEKVAFSNAKMKLFGPPSFEECSFNLQEDTMISISL